MEAVLKTIACESVNFDKGRGASLWDDEGRRYLDLESGSWSAILGHSHPAVTSTIRRQAGRLMHLNVRHPSALCSVAAERLLALTGQTGGACIFLSSGSEAVEFAVQAILKATGRPKLLKLQNAYMAAYGTAAGNTPDTWLTIKWRGRERLDIEKQIEALPWHELAGFVLEPGGASPAFLHFPPTWLVEQLATVARKAGGYVVSNEITTGMAKTGQWFGFQHYAIAPDAVAVGKGLGNGYPVSAAALSAGLAAAYEDSGAYYAQSHQNNPLGCAVALAVMDELEDGDWRAKARQIEEWTLAGLRSLPDPHGYIADIRGRGALAGIEFAGDRGLTGEKAYRALWERRIISAAYPAKHPAGTGLRFDIPLCVTAGDLERLMKSLRRIIEAPSDRVRQPAGAAH